MVTMAIELNWEKYAEELDADVRLALVRALNRVTDSTRTRAARMARDQINFPASYLNPSKGKLTVTSRANREDMETMISGRDRPTSLARFTRQQPGQKRGQGVAVSVAGGGRRKVIKRAFLIKLKNDNIGLAVRTAGGPPEGAWKPKEIGKNLYLLYGPSVDQALVSARGGDGIYEEIAPEALAELENEFGRQLDLLRG